MIAKYPARIYNGEKGGMNMSKKLPSVRLAGKQDLPKIAAIYDHARAFMYANGNTTQWPTNQYPALWSAELDLEDGILYVTEMDGAINGTFVLMPGPDATYNVIENGSWRADTPYGAIHRVASLGGGTLAAALEFAKVKYDHIRMDTHRDNAPMRHLLEKAGFSCRGVIYVEDGTPRLAFDLLKEA